MPNSPISDTDSNLSGKLTRTKGPFKLTPTQIAIAASLVIALLIYGPHLFNLTVPIEGDARAHIFKIEILHTYLSQGYWPQWVPYWYNGLPVDPFYPRGFYFTGAALTFIFKHAVIAYKLLLLVSLMSNGLVTYYFARRFLRFDWLPSLLCLVAYESSTPLLVNYLYGEGPNLLCWSISLVFLTVYLSRVAEGKIRRPMDILLPGFLLGSAILIHPFSVLFVSLAVILFHLIWQAHNRQAALKPQLIYFALVMVIGGLIGMNYWLPVLLTFKYASPIYTFPSDAWVGGMPYLLAFTLLALTLALIIRKQRNGDYQFDFLVACFLLASVLGFGGSRYLPFGLDSLLHEFRFATIMAPFFGILIIGWVINHRPLQLKRYKIAPAFLTSAFLTFFVFIISKLGFLLRFFSAAQASGSGISYYSLISFVLRDFRGFVVIILPIFVILLLAFSQDFHLPETTRDKLAITLPMGACLILLMSIIPYAFTSNQAKLSRLFSYVDNYRQPEYAQVLQAVKDSRLVIPTIRGYLLEGDSPVTFGWHWGVETVNGPYNQGDPKFFKYTVHLEWEERWLDHESTRENLMQEGAAGYIFIRDTQASLKDLSGLSTTVSNNYGTLLELDQDVARADRVTPVLLDVKDPRGVTEFFNILFPQGYKIVFVDAHDVDSNLKDKFNYAMIDDMSSVSDYQGKEVFLLEDVPQFEVSAVIQETGFVRLKVPCTTFTNRLFYHGDEGDVKAWGNFEGSVSIQSVSNELAAMQMISKQLGPLLQNLDYEAADYKYSRNSIEINTGPGFTLVKDSYFPYWSSRQGQILPTTQGFMLVSSNESTIVLEYDTPAAFPATGAVSIVALMAAIAILAMNFFTRRRHTDRSYRP